MTTSPILDRLRAETREAHEHLEADVGIERRVQDPDGYRSLLDKFLGFYEPLERQLTAMDGWAEYGLDVSARRKTPWLREDLAALGSTVPTTRCDVLPRLDTLARGFGCAYVLEGATLGGRQISGLLKESAVPEQARHFFASYGAAVGDRWREFIAALDRFATSGGNADEIVAAARETFTSLRGWLSEKETVPA